MMSSACSGSRAALRGARTRGGRSRVRRVADLAGVRLGTAAQPGVGQTRGDRAADDGSADSQDSGGGGPRGPGGGLTAENQVVFVG